MILRGGLMGPESGNKMLSELMEDLFLSEIIAENQDEELDIEEDDL